MSAGAALQVSMIAALRADPSVAALLGQRVYDNSPVAEVFPYLTLGPAQELDDSAECIDGSEVFQQIDIWTQEGGSQLSAKLICGAVRDALNGADLVLADPYALLLIEVESMSVVGDPDEKIAHGIVNVRALVEGVS